jgi:hypothetical protein
VGWVVGYWLDHLPTVGFKGFRLGWFTSKPKLVCEKMGSSLGLAPGAGPRVFSDLGSVSFPEDVVGPQARLVSSPSTVKALSSFATRDFEVQQSGSSQVRSAFAGGCVLAQVVSIDSVLVSALEDVALPSLLIANPVAPRFVFPPSPTFSSGLLFSAPTPLSRTTETLSSASLEVSLKSEGSSSAPVGIGDGSFSSGDSFSGAAELGWLSCFRVTIGGLEKVE